LGAKYVEKYVAGETRLFLFGLEGIGEGGFADHLVEDWIVVGVDEIAEGDFAGVVGGEFAGGINEAALLGLSIRREGLKPVFTGDDR